MDPSEYKLRLQGAGPSPTHFFWLDPYRARKSPLNRPISAGICKNGAKKWFLNHFLADPYSFHVRPWVASGAIHGRHRVHHLLVCYSIQPRMAPLGGAIRVTPWSVSQTMASRGPSGHGVWPEGPATCPQGVLWAGPGPGLSCTLDSLRPSGQTLCPEGLAICPQGLP